MKKYEKPSVQVIELQIKEDIAALPTTVYKRIGGNTNSSGQAFQMALSMKNTGLGSSNF